MNKNEVDEVDITLHDMISAGLSQQADAVDVRMQARLRRARVKAVSANQEPSWLGRLWQTISVPSLVRAPIAQASVAMLVAVFSISLVFTPFNSVSETVSGAEIQQNGSQALSEMDVLMSNEDMEFLENLEIYEWLVAEYG